MAGFQGITISHINIRSLNRKLEEIIRILDQSDSEILCISESWLNQSVPDHMVGINGYNLIRSDRTRESGKLTGGGLIIYYKKELNVTCLEELTICTPNIETLWVKLQLKQSRPQYIGLVYRPPDGDVDSATEILMNQITAIRARGNGDIMLTGDINVDWNKQRESRTKKLIDFYKISGLKNLINGVTCHNSENESCIDHIAVNREEMFELHGIIGLNASDHNLVYAVRKHPKTRKSYKFIWARSYKTFQHTVFERDIIFENWADVLDEDNVSYAWDNFANKLIKIVDKHAPVKKLKIKDSLPKWVTREYIQACDVRDSLYRTYVKNKSDINKREMKRSRNYVTKLKNDLKRDYFKHALRVNKGNSKKLWQTVNEAFGKTNNKSTNITEIAGETDQPKMAEVMNDYFTTIAENLARGFPHGDPVQTERTTHQPKLQFKHTTEQDVAKLIRQLSDATAVGIDGISPRILKAALTPLSIIISRLINKSLDTGVFPDALKVAKVSPIYKSGDRTDPGNYRPISVLPAVSKLFERIVHTQLSDYLDKYSLLSDCQFGFRKNHSTETCCLSMLDKMYRQLDQGRVGGVVFLDLKKAFDTVDHAILLRKLSSIGVSNQSIKWFESYLCNRQQVIKIDQCISSKKRIEYGVPQGSILGPLLFLVFINDLNNCIELCGTSMYADDTAVFYFADDAEELRMSIQYDMQSISYWMTQNRLSLNVAKTKFMMVGSRPRLSRQREFKVSLNRETVENVETFKYLGMILDKHLCFNHHIDHIVNKTTTKLGLLYKTRYLFNEGTALMLYKSLITPHFDYGSILYEVAPQYQLQRLQTIQNAAARLILLEQPDCPIYTLHERLKLDTLATRRSKSMVKVIFNCLHDKEPMYLYEQLVPVQHAGRQTRAMEAGLLQIPKMKTNLGQHAFCFRGPVQWNLTQPGLKAAVNKIQLKNLLQTSWYGT